MATCGLGSQFLESLYLEELRFKEIPRHAVSHMPSLETLSLKRNGIRTLNADMFDPDIKEHHRRLLLNLEANSPLQCDSDLCWMKEAQKFGSLGVYSARCIGGFYFHHIDSEYLNCTEGKHCSLFFNLICIT